MPYVQRVARREAVRRSLRAQEAPPVPGLVGGLLRRARAAVGAAWSRLDVAGRARVGWARAAGPIRLGAVGVAVPLLVWHFVLGDEGWVARRNLRVEIERREAEIAAIEARIEDLRAEIRRLADDPAAIEAAVRDDLGLVRPNETVYRVVEAARPLAARSNG